MIERKREFSRRELRWFGPLFALFGAVLGGIAQWKFGAAVTANAIWLACAVVIAVYYAAPPLRRPIFAAWLALVFPIGWVLSHVLLSIVFYAVVFPTGLALRLFRHDPLRRRFDRRAETYWIQRETRTGARRYFRQY